MLPFIVPAASCQHSFAPCRLTRCPSSLIGCQFYFVQWMAQNIRRTWLFFAFLIVAWWTELSLDKQVRVKEFLKVIFKAWTTFPIFLPFLLEMLFALHQGRIIDIHHLLILWPFKDGCRTHIFPFITNLFIIRVIDSFFTDAIGLGNGGKGRLIGWNRWWGKWFFQQGPSGARSL